MKSLFYIMLFTSATAYVACNDSGNAHNSHNHNSHEHGMSHEEVPVMTATMETDTFFQKQVDRLAHMYTHIQVALANDDVEEVQSRSKQLSNHMNDFETSMFTENEQQLYTRYGVQIKELSGVIMVTKDIEEQRIQFKNLSDAVYQLVKNAGVSEPLYKSYCPMAFDGKGAMWLSDTKSIANPYFGEAMYSCGSVEEVIKR